MASPTNLASTLWNTATTSPTSTPPSFTNSASIPTNSNSPRASVWKSITAKSFGRLFEGQKNSSRFCLNPASASLACRPGRRLLCFFFQLGLVTGFLNRRDELLRIRFALLDFYNRLVGMGHLSADNPRNFFKCRPHFFRTVNGSGHARNRKVHSFLCLGFGRLRI